MPITTIQAVAKSAIDLFDEGKEVYEFVANAMDSLEKSTLSGKDKLTSVLAVTRDTFNFLNSNWAEWHIKLVNFIQNIKSLYNIIVKGF